MTPMPEDCKAAADWMDSYSAEWDTTSTNKVRAGDLSFGEGLPEAFMRHRLAAEAAAFEKAAGVAAKAATEWAQTKAYLRQHGNDGPYLSEPTGFSIATAIRKLAGEKHD